MLGSPAKGRAPTGAQKFCVSKIEHNMRVDLQRGVDLLEEELRKKAFIKCEAQFSKSSKGQKQ